MGILKNSRNHILEANILELEIKKNKIMGILKLS